MTTDLSAIALRQVQSLDPSKRVVVIHPNYTQQHSLLSVFLQDETAIYVRFEGRRAPYAEIKATLQREMQSQGTAGQAAGTLILDEVDRADREGFGKLLLEVLHTSTIKRIVVIGREIPTATLTEPELVSQTAFVPTQPDIMLTDYGQSKRSETLLEVRALGNGQAMVDGRAINNWDGLLPRSLFFYLVDRSMATRNDIFATFWPKLTTREATNVFHVTKRKINEVLGIDLTIYYSGYYRISPDIHLTYDTTLFSQLFQNSEVAAPADAEEFLMRALALYRGSFLATTQMEWAARRRAELAESYAEALVGLAAIREGQGRLAQALGLYGRAVNNSDQQSHVLMQVERLSRILKLPFDNGHYARSAPVELVTEHINSSMAGKSIELPAAGRTSKTTVKRRGTQELNPAV